MASKDSKTDPRSMLAGYMARHGLKASRQRDTIADVFFDAEGHLTVEDLLKKVHAVDPKISQATVYRTVKLLADSGVAEPRQFHDGQTRYELSDKGDHHHDHLICTQCGRIVEFVDDRIEELQDEVARAHGFTVTDHKMELYGRCGDCGGPG